MQFFPVVNTPHQAAADSADDERQELWAQLKPEGRDDLPVPCNGPRSLVRRGGRDLFMAPTDPFRMYSFRA